MEKPKYKFQENLLKFSNEKDDITKAIAEWGHICEIKLKRGEALCTCGNKNVMNFQIFLNTKNAKMIYTGNECAKKLGLRLGQGNGMNADLRQFIIMNPAVYTTLNDLTYSEDVRIKFIEYITRQVDQMPDLHKAYTRIQELINKFKTYNYTFVELETLCERIAEKIQKKEAEEWEKREREEQKKREREEREKREREEREKLEREELVDDWREQMANYWREERRVRNERSRAEYKRRRREKQIQEDYHDTNQMSTNLQDAFKTGDMDAIRRMMFP
jgi:hypothetical protein